MGVAKQRPVGNKEVWNWGNNEHVVAFHHDLAGGEASDMAAIIRAGVLTGDLHVDKLAISLENAPGGGKSVTVTLGNGTSLMTAIASEAETSKSSTTNNFDLDVSAEDLTILVSSTAGTAPGCLTIFMTYHDVEDL